MPNKFITKNRRQSVNNDFEVNKKIENIDSNKFTEKFPLVLFVDNNGLLKVNNLLTGKEVTVAQNVYNFFVNDTYVFVGIIGNEISELYDLNTFEKIKSFDFDLNLPAKMNSDFCYGSITRNGTPSIIKYSLRLNEQVGVFERKKGTNFNSLIDDNSYLAINDHSIMSIVIETAVLNWELRLSDIVNFCIQNGIKIPEYIAIQNHQIYGTKLIVKLNTDHIISVNLTNGNINWVLNIDCYTTSPQLDSEGDLFHLVLRPIDGKFYKIDLTTGKILLEKKLPEGWNEKLGIRLTNFSISDRYVLLSTARRPMDSLSHYILFFDKNTGDLVDKIPFQYDGSINKPPMLHNSRLYQLDANGTLHVFDQN